MATNDPPSRMHEIRCNVFGRKWTTEKIRQRGGNSVGHGRGHGHGRGYDSSMTVAATFIQETIQPAAKSNNNNSSNSNTATTVKWFEHSVQNGNHNDNDADRRARRGHSQSSTPTTLSTTIPVARGPKNHRHASILVPTYIQRQAVEPPTTVSFQNFHHGNECGCNTTTTTATTTLEKETETYNNFDSDASYSPRFAHFCRKHGSLTAYHGTHMDHVWSILNNGFWNMSSSSLPGGGNGSSGNEFVKNGAMLGSGVYLTTSHKVASFFATSGGNRNACKQAFANALQHGSLRNLLQLQLDDYDVSCFPVFEAKIIRPPDAAQDREGRKPRAGGGTTFSPMAATATNGNGNDATTTNADSGGTYYYEATRQEGKYYVVPDGRDIKITRLHLTFELVSKKRGVIASYLSQLLSNMNHHPILLGIIGLLISVVYLHCTSKKNDGYMV
mmetsp:Transcript_4618/g.8701  ORF Transcript_4618/g.8701 Transcript_4618/m.8701 type:complete len:444 (+) Transcript_4618:117-1448(+)